MSAAHVRRGAPTRAKARKPAARAPKRIASKLPVSQRRANRLAGLAFLMFLLVIGVVVTIALDIPSKAATSAGAAIGRAGFTVNGYQRVGRNRMKRSLVEQVIVGESRSTSEAAGSRPPAQPLVDVAAHRRG